MMTQREARTLYDEAFKRAKELGRRRYFTSAEAILESIAKDLKVPNVVNLNSNQVGEALRRIRMFGSKPGDAPF